MLGFCVLGLGSFLAAHIVVLRRFVGFIIDCDFKLWCSLLDLVSFGYEMLDFEKISGFRLGLVAVKIEERG